MLTKQLRVRRRQEQVPEYGYVDTRTVHYQDLVLQKLIDGHVIRTTVIDTEVIPEGVVFELACLGSTDWKSKWATVFPEAYAH